MTSRDDLLAEVQREREYWRELVSEVGEERMDEPGPMGQWTFKDLTAHITGWRMRTIARLQAGPDGDPTPPWPDHLTEVDEINDWIHQQNRDKPLDQVLTEADQSFESLANALNGLSDEDLTTPGRFAWMEGEALVNAELFGHLHEEHEPSIRAWLNSR